MADRQIIPTDHSLPALSSNSFVINKRRREQFGRHPLVYIDVIAPNDEPIQRRWEACLGRFGIGGPSPAEVFCELVQLCWPS